MRERESGEREKEKERERVTCVHCRLFCHLHFREKWYGLLFSQLFNSKKSNLVLCVFYPNSDVPWLGPIQYLGTNQPTTVMSDPRVAQQTQSQPGDLFPIGPPRPPSFSSPSDLLWAKETVLQVYTCMTVGSDIYTVVRVDG